MWSCFLNVTDTTLKDIRVASCNMIKLYQVFPIKNSDTSLQWLSACCGVISYILIFVAASLPLAIRYQQYHLPAMMAWRSLDIAQCTKSFLVILCCWIWKKMGSLNFWFVSAVLGIEHRTLHTKHAPNQCATSTFPVTLFMSMAKSHKCSSSSKEKHSSMSHLGIRTH